MKKNAFALMLTVLVFLLAGCGGFTASQSNSRVPGSVTGLLPDEDGSRKIVTFNVVGKGLEPETAVTKGEAILMAERAAVADGYRQFIEKIHGVYVNAYMKAGYGSVNHEMIKTQTQSWLRGVEVLEIRRMNHRITEVHMQLRVNFTKKRMVWWPSGIGSNAISS